MAQALKFGKGVWATKTGSSMAYNDQNDNYKPLPFNVERDSTATRVNKEGLIEVVGHDKLRIDYTDTDKGVALLEPSRSNIFDYSSNLSAWTKLNSIVTESSVLSLDGVNNSYAYERTSSSTSYIYRTVSLSNTTVYTLSFFAKSGTSTNVRTDIWDTTQSTQCQIKVDLVTKAVSDFIGTSYEIKDYTNGWMRISVTFTSESSFGTTFNRYFNSDSVGTELYIWGAQLEQGSYATSYIPTSGSAVQRAADVAYNAGNSEVFNNVEGTIFINANFVNNSGVQVICSVHDNATNKRLEIWANGNVVNGFIGGSSNITVGSSSLTNRNYKIALNYKSGNSSFYIDGFLIGESNTAFTLASLTQLNLCYLNPNQYQSVCPTKEIGYYDEILTDSELEYLTSYRSLSELVKELNLNTL